MKARAKGLLILFAALLSFACGAAEQTDGGNRSAANANSGASSQAQPASVTSGDALFSRNNCVQCHGADGKGNPKVKGVPDLTSAEWQRQKSDEEFIATIKNGKKPMPAFGSRLTDEEIKTLVAYVRSFAK